MLTLTCRHQLRRLALLQPAPPVRRANPICLMRGLCGARVPVSHVGAAVVSLAVSASLVTRGGFALRKTGEAAAGP
jgi:hypothetical protein